MDKASLWSCGRGSLALLITFCVYGLWWIRNHRPFVRHKGKKNAINLIINREHHHKLYTLLGAVLLTNFER
jgi:hypothetical protein